MTHRALVRPLAAVLGTALAACAFAQTAPSRAVPALGAPVVTDVGPPPAEDRSSTGAIVLEKSPVRAQRDSTAVMGNVAAPAERALTRAEQRRKRDDDAALLRKRGAAGLIEK